MGKFKLFKELIQKSFEEFIGTLYKQKIVKTMDTDLRIKPGKSKILKGSKKPPQEFLSMRKVEF
ncbi:hypothetical protein LBHB_16800 [Leptospira borgpetersenii serovar Hardjo]|nr:hypothetical protein LBHB_16800 [Leptospira borgpetersenii serovar Hardjo]